MTHARATLAARWAAVGVAVAAVAALPAPAARADEPPAARTDARPAQALAGDRDAPPPATTAPPATVVAPPRRALRARARAALAGADALARRVSALRGLRQRRPIRKDAIDHDELLRRLSQLDEREREAMTRDERLTKHWGLVPQDLDYRAAMTAALARDLAGYYDLHEKRLSLALDNEMVTDRRSTELVLAHELVHALQDQTFDLLRLADLPPEDMDRAAALEALIEGDGVAVMLEIASARRSGLFYLPGALDVEQATELAQELVDDDQSELPVTLRRRLMFPYAAGLVFVTALRRRDGWRAVDHAFAALPVSTEQILHPERYFAGDTPRPLPALTFADAPFRTPPLETVWGELGLSLFLRQHGVSEELARAAAEGWGGDRISVLGGAGEPEIGVARLCWDDERQAREALPALIAAMERWLGGPPAEAAADGRRWRAADGALSSLERRGAAILLLHRAAADRAAPLAAAAWSALAEPCQGPGR